MIEHRTGRNGVFLSDLLYRPRRLFLRRALFQVHLWLGVLLSLYLVLISLSGAVLVYHDALKRSTLPAGFSPFDSAHTAPIPAVIAAAQTAFPQANVESVAPPSGKMPAFLLKLQNSSGKPFQVLADPRTGSLQPMPRNWVDVVYDFHLYILLGSAHGMQWNGVGAAGLLVLAFTGILLWWRGLKSWWGALGISLRHHWRRLNFDLHHALGFWTLSIVSWWALSGVYFAWYRPFTAAVNAISPLVGQKQPDPLSPPPVGAPASLQAVLAAAHRASPRGALSSLSNPTLKPGQDVYAYMTLRSPEDLWHADIVRIDARSGSILSVWHYGENHTPGDWFLWSLQPLHFGTIWGPWVRALWCLLGVSLAVLTVTGLLMYWNRYLRFRWQALVAPRPSPSSDAGLHSVARSPAGPSRAD